MCTARIKKTPRTNLLWKENDDGSGTIQHITTLGFVANWYLERRRL
jgi:hypothetical protein